MTWKDLKENMIKALLFTPQFDTEIVCSIDQSRNFYGNHFCYKRFLMNENILFYSKLVSASHCDHNSPFFSNLKINGPEKNYDCVFGCDAQGEINSLSILQISSMRFYLFWWCSLSISCLQNIKPVMVLGNIFKLNHICYPSLWDISFLIWNK